MSKITAQLRKRQAPTNEELAEMHAAGDYDGVIEALVGVACQVAQEHHLSWRSGKINSRDKMTREEMESTAMLALVEKVPSWRGGTPLKAFGAMAARWAISNEIKGINTERRGGHVLHEEINDVVKAGGSDMDRELGDGRSDSFRRRAAIYSFEMLDLDGTPVENGEDTLIDHVDGVMLREKMARLLTEEEADLLEAVAQGVSLRQLGREYGITGEGIRKRLIIARQKMTTALRPPGPAQGGPFIDLCARNSRRLL